MKSVITINVVIVSKAVVYVWNGFVKRTIMKQYHREKRELERLAVSEGKVFVGRSQLLLATGMRTPSCIASRRQETAPTVACFKPPNA